MNKIDKIRDLHQFFLRTFKPKGKVILRLANMIDHASYIYNTKTKTHYITLNKRDSLEMSYENLQHEWGHLLEYNKWGNEPHSDAWALKYGKTYRAYLKWKEIQDK